jgi:hypothetical protein
MVREGYLCRALVLASSLLNGIYISISRRVQPDAALTDAD